MIKCFHDHSGSAFHKMKGVCSISSQEQKVKNYLITKWNYYVHWGRWSKRGDPYTPLCINPFSA